MAAITTASIDHALSAVAKYGGIRSAARATGLPYGHFQRRALAAKARVTEKPRYRVPARRSVDASAFATPALKLTEPVNDRILIISDLHAPYQHKDALAFLAALHSKYDFTRIICAGDELDMHALSYHEHDPDLDSAGRELHNGRHVLWELESLFPVVDLLESNHGSLLYRKGRTAGIPRHMLTEYRDVVFGEKGKGGSMYRPGGRGKGWTWHPRLTVTLPTGRKCKFVHQGVTNSLTNVQKAGISHVQGHYHSLFNIQWHGTTEALNFGMVVGCLIDDDSYAYRYNKLQEPRPIIGCGGILHGIPVLFPMILDRGGVWNGHVP